MNIILDNIIFSLQRHGGVSVLWGYLIIALNKQSVPIIMLEYSDAVNNNQIRSQLKNLDTEIIQLNGNVKFQRWVNPKINLSSPFIFHSSHYRICTNKYAINITTVHDFVYEHYFKGLQKFMHCRQKYNAIRKSDIIICISENTKKDLIRFLPDVDKEKIRVIYNGVAEDYKQINETYPNYSDYLLYVGGRQSYKNFGFAIDGANMVNKKLLIVGGDLNKKEKAILDEKLGNNNYQIIKHPDNKELNKLYNSVFALVYPSSYEGFGIPVIEAQRAGCPVIALNSSSIPEIIGDKTLLLDNLDLNDFKSKIEYLTNPNSRANIIKKGLENSKRFSWDKMTQEYIDLYREFLYEKHD